MKKHNNSLKILVAAIAFGIIGMSYAGTKEKTARDTVSITHEEASALNDIPLGTAVFTAEQVEQNITASQEALMAIIEALESRVVAIEENGGGQKIAYPAVVTNSIVAGNETLLVLSPDPNGGTISQLPPFVTNSITAGDQTILVLSPAE